MSEQAAVYSCPSCGALSKVNPAAGGGSVCGECGYEFRQSARVAPRTTSSKGRPRFVQRDVVSRRRQVEREKTVLPPQRERLAEVDSIKEEDPAVPGGDEVISDDGHRRVIRRKKKRRRSSRMRTLWLSVLWICMVAAVFLMLKHRMETNGVGLNPPISDQERERLARAAGIRAYVDRQMPECRKVLSAFWGSSSYEALTEYVHAPLRVTPLMFRYSQEHEFPVPQGEVRLLDTNLVAVRDLRAIETVWQDEDDRRFEVVFLRERGKWKIDWEAYVRYCSSRWSFFVSRAVRGEGDFRLYMRRIKFSDPDDGGHIGLKFYPAEYEQKTRWRGESPTVQVREDSELGARVQAVLDGLKHEVEPGAPALRAADPENMARVRVVLEWRDTPEGEPVLHLKELKARSWYAEEIAAELEAAAALGGPGKDGGPGEPAVRSGPGGPEGDG